MDSDQLENFADHLPASNITQKRNLIDKISQVSTEIRNFGDGDQGLESNMEAKIQMEALQ